MKLEQKTSPNLENEVDIQKEEIFRTLHRYHQRKISVRHIIKMSKIQIKEQYQKWYE